MPKPVNPCVVGIYCELPELMGQAKSLAQQLNSPLINTSPASLDAGGFVLVVNEMGIALQASGKKAPGPIRVDFTGGASAHRRQFGGGKGQMIAKAIGIKSAYRPHIVDLTAGLGQDAFVLATLGCQMSLVERSAIVYRLLRDGLARAELVADDTLQAIVSRMSLTHSSGADYLSTLSAPVDVIYLDPMFPQKTHKAEVNKSMKAFHQVVGEDNDAGELLQQALSCAQYRVVVKRPRKAPALNQQYGDLGLPEPNIVFEGKSTRFDVYTRHKMP